MYFDHIQTKDYLNDYHSKNCHALENGRQAYFSITVFYLEVSLLPHPCLFFCTLLYKILVKHLVSRVLLARVVAAPQAFGTDTRL